MSKARKFIHDWIWLALLVFCVGGLFNPKIGLAAVICMMGPFVLAFFKGRFWCGSFCPRGSFNDVILPKISLKRPIPAFIRTYWFRNLFFIAMMSFFAVQLVLAWGDINAAGLVFVRMVIITTVLTIVLGSIFKPRTWCTFCPMGTLAHYASKLRFSKRRAEFVTFKSDTCTGCKVCSSSCPMEIDPLLYKELGRVKCADCIKCYRCIQKCPVKSLYHCKEIT